MKAKFCTYLEIDLNGMPTKELAELKKEIEAVLELRYSNQPRGLLEVFNNSNGVDTRIVSGIEWLLKKKASDITIAEVMDITKTRLLTIPNLGRKAVERIDEIVNELGYGRLAG